MDGIALRTIARIVDDLLDAALRKYGNHNTNAQWGAAAPEQYAWYRRMYDEYHARLRLEAGLLAKEEEIKRRTEDERKRLLRELTFLRRPTWGLDEIERFIERPDAEELLIGDAARREGEADGEKARGRRRRKKPPTEKPLTARQVEVMQIVGECQGNKAEGARRLGCDRKTVAEALEAGMAKMGKLALALKPKTVSMPLDRRGQESIATGDDRRG